MGTLTISSTQHYTTYNDFHEVILIVFHLPRTRIRKAHRICRKGRSFSIYLTLAQSEYEVAPAHSPAQSEKSHLESG